MHGDDQRQLFHQAFQQSFHDGPLRGIEALEQTAPLAEEHRDEVELGRLRATAGIRARQAP